MLRLKGIEPKNDQGEKLICPRPNTISYQSAADIGSRLSWREFIGGELHNFFDKLLGISACRRIRRPTDSLEVRLG